MVLEKTLESPLDSKEIKLVNSKGNQSWIFIGGTDAEAEAPIVWLPDVKNWLIGKDPDAGKDWRWEGKGMTEDEMVGWHHWFYGHGERGGDGETNGMSKMETSITICKRDSQARIRCMAQQTQTGALYQPRGVGWWGRWEGGLKGRGIYVNLWLIHVEVWQKITKFGKAIILQ